MTSNPIKVLVVGCGNMGKSHARAYHTMDEFKIVGLVSRNPESREGLSQELGGYPTFDNYETALQTARPDAVSINTYPDTHAPYVEMALHSGAHVFVEKPLALTVEEAQNLVDLAHERELKMVVGYILRVHPAWSKFIDLAKTLGKPLVMRMNLNQQSCGNMWYTHRQLMKSMSPIVDCGVHYVDVMCLMTGANPVKVSAIGARLTKDVAPTMYNYGQLQVSFDDGSVGWYEAGWGPMMSETAFFVKDVIGPKGSVSIVDESGERSEGSQDIEGHSKTGGIKLHHAELTAEQNFARQDEFINTADEPSHDELCHLEQEFFLKAIQGQVKIDDHLRDAVNSLRIVLAADRSFKEGETIHL